MLDDKVGILDVKVKIDNKINCDKESNKAKKIKHLNLQKI